MAGSRSKKRKVAVFDIDGTIFRSSLLIEITDALVAAGIFPERVEQLYKAAKFRWLDRKAHYDEYLKAVIKVFDRHIKGVHHVVFQTVASRVALIHKDRVYRYTRDLAKTLKAKGYFLLAISHSPKAAVDEFAQYLHFDKMYGRLIETNENGIYNGRTVMPELIFDKAKVLARAIEKENLTTQDSVGVGDTESDIPLLSSVENPIAFNPNKKLYEYAMKKGWKIVVERKDVIYELK